MRRIGIGVLTCAQPNNAVQRNTGVKVERRKGDREIEPSFWGWAWIIPELGLLCWILYLPYLVVKWLLNVFTTGWERLSV